MNMKPPMHWGKWERFLLIALGLYLLATPILVIAALLKWILY